MARARVDNRPRICYNRHMNTRTNKDAYEQLLLNMIKEAQANKNRHIEKRNTELVRKWRIREKERQEAYRLYRLFKRGKLPQ